jgi:pimeloyl-ACP methyl ester carboxylesterase
MPTTRSLEVDVTDAAGLPGPLQVAVTVTLPDPAAMVDPPIVCFGYPGGGYSRGYYTFDMPGASGGGEACWHAARGWIFVSCDHLGVGDSSLPDPATLTYTPVAAANHHAAMTVLQQLADRTLDDAFPAVKHPITLGIGQSMGGCLAVIQQARHDTFDAIGVLGYSAIHTYPVTRPGVPDQPFPYVPRDADPAAPFIANPAMLAARGALWAGVDTSDEVHPMAWGFHYSDVSGDIVRVDLDEFPTRHGSLPEWASATVPGLAAWVLTPGAIAAEAASILKPVLVASGERDVVPDPWLEPKAYKACTDVSVFVCPRMGHMHNFAGTRELLWRRIESFGNGVAALKDLNPPWVTNELR